MGRRILAIGLILSFLFGGMAKADHSNHPNFIDWRLLELWTYEYEYEWLENSTMVGWLQYWLGVEQDGVYGRQTHIAHRQKAMELNVKVNLFWDMVVEQDYGPEVEQWRGEVALAIERYGGPSGDVNRFLSVMRCESGGNPEAYNQSSGASGLMQHLQVYWPPRARAAGYEGASPFDPIANINVSAWLIYQATGGGWQHWVCL
jgi:hypothetical protein